MDITELKKAAFERELSVIKKRSTGPITVLEAKTGKLVGVFHDVHEAFAVVETYPIIPPVVPVPAEWTSIAQVSEAPKHCPNGYGPDCLCMDDSFLYLCAVGPCPNQARCNGVCLGHFSQLRIFGNLTKAAIKKTDEYHKEGKRLYNFPATLPMKFYVPSHRDWTTLKPAEIQKATDGIIGMSVKYTGDEYLLLDKDGNVLDRVKTKQELFEESE